MDQIDESKRKEEQEKQNLIQGFELIKNQYALQLERLRCADEKSNMILVFNGAILALLIAVLPFDFIEKPKFIASIIIFSFFIVSVLITIASIFIGLYPKQLSQIDMENYSNTDTYQCEAEQFFGKFIAAYKCAMESLQSVIEQKHKMNKVAMVFTSVNLVLMISMIIIKII